MAASSITGIPLYTKIRKLACRGRVRLLLRHIRNRCMVGVARSIVRDGWPNLGFSICTNIPNLVFSLRPQAHSGFIGSDGRLKEHAVLLRISSNRAKAAKGHKGIAIRIQWRVVCARGCRRAKLLQPRFPSAPPQKLWWFQTRAICGSIRTSSFIMLSTWSTTSTRPSSPKHCRWVVLTYRFCFVRSE